MRIVFLGPPGAGKGTQAAHFSEELDLPHISTGDIFRDNIKNETALGEELKSYVEKGELVPDDLVVRIVGQRLGRADCAEGFILDGFPRTTTQAEEFESYLKLRGRSLDKVIFFKLNTENLIDRLTSRRVCSNEDCRANYNVSTNPPSEDGVCDECGSKLRQRKDDTRETIETRMEEFEEQTKPLVDYYQAKGILAKVQADGSIEEVRKAVAGQLS